MVRNPTIFDVATAAGVSKSTVSLVIRNNPIVSDSARAKVVAAMAELGYVYNRGAASLRQARSSVIGVIVNDLTNSFFAELAVGMDMLAQSAGFVQMLAHTGESVDRQREVISTMREHGVSGIIISGARGTTPDDLKSLVSSGIPLVLGIRDIPGVAATRVISENRAGIYEATRHLISLGHQRIGFLGGFADTAIFHARLQGMRDALAEANLEFHDKFVVSSYTSRVGGLTAMQSLLASPDRPSACLCINDAVAFGAWDALRSAGIEPGRQFGLIGFDDVMEARAAVPALTTISIDPQGMGRRMVEVLLQQISAGRVEPELITMPARLVVRESCGAPWRKQAAS